jgi:hypothetical protein
VKLRELHASLAKRDDWTVRPIFTTRYAADYATWLAGLKQNTILEQLERAVASRDVPAIRKVLASEPWRWLQHDDRFHGDPIKLAEYLEEQNKQGLEQAELVSDLLSLTPVGPFAKVVVTTPTELLKWKTGQQSGWTTILNIGLKALTGPLDRLRGSTVLRTAIIQGVRGALEQGARNSVKILSSDRTWEEKIELLSEAWKAAVLAGFTGAILGEFREVTRDMDEGTRKELTDALLEAAEELGVKKPVQDELDKFAPDPPKRGTW